MYASVQPSGTSDALLWHRLGAKTLALVHGHITNVTVTGTGLDEVIVDVDTIEAIRQLALPDIDTVDINGNTITVAEAFDTIDARIRRALDRTGHTHYQRLSERLERLRQHQLNRAEASIDFLRELLDIAQQVAAAERTETEQGIDALDLLPDPTLGALTQIFREYAPADTPVIIEAVVADIDAIVRQVASSGWQTSQPGDREVRVQIRLVLRKYGLPPSGELFNRAHAYIRENY